MRLGAVLRFYQTSDLAAGFVVADNGDERCGRPQRPQVAQHVSRAAQRLHFAFDPQYRDRCFGRHSLDLAINVVIEHYVADAQHARRF
jgi:ribosomal protein S18 acetylase RimI-like enzyme